MSAQPSLQDYVDAARGILENLLRFLEFDDARLDAAVVEGQIQIQILTADTGRIIGRTSQTLDALQFLLNRLLSRQFEDSPYCVVDAGEYRARRREKLLQDANDALARVRQNGQPWRMPLLNAMERRIIHQALKDLPDVQTHSEDEDAEGRKRVVISLAAPVAAEESAPEAAPEVPPPEIPS